ncbi:MAG: DUF1080 domain-containing protein [Gemmataceae bacterium]|nr:DUF1080 domain-containing protein [Gemmataceae bacterium]
MKSLAKHFLLTLLLATAPFFSLAQEAKKAQAKKPAEVYTKAEDAGPDFKIQGDYSGTVEGKGKLGAQVVAKGDGKFEVYILEGGLPGDGWDGKTRVKVSAKTADDKVDFSGAKWQGNIESNRLVGKNPSGENFTLTRVERKSPTMGAKPPAGAVVLFDGSSPEHWSNGKITEEVLLLRGTQSKKPFATGKFHFEFRTPFQPKAGGQGRGNSGVYILGNEIQVLDSFGLTGEQNECGGLYGHAKPLVNMCLPPLTWQTFDIETAPAGEDAISYTVIHNGVKVHDGVVIKGNAKKGQSILLQDHGNPVAYRNIWVLEAK